MIDRPLMRLNPSGGRRARAGAPWVFANELVMDARARALPPGSLVEVEGDDGRAFGPGYFNSRSLIAVRLFECAPRTAIDRAFLAGRLRAALVLREALFERPFYRLVHAEGDRLPGLTIDRFGDICAVQVTTAGMEALLDPLLLALDEVAAPATVVLRNDAPVRALEGLDSYVRLVKGEAPARISLEENGTRYLVDVLGGQKAGWYYDQRDNRAFVAGLARGKSLLDAYCHSGGFSLAAARLGATEANGLDSSAPALALAADAAAANGVTRACKFVRADVIEEFERLASAGETFDVVVADPPPFARARKDVESGARAYRRLARLAARVTAPGGFLALASCSHVISPERFQAECAAGIARAGRRAALIRQAGAGPDHPVHPMLPETAYLKMLVYAVE